MECGKHGEEKNKLSLGLMVSDHKIKLIDMLTEDDDDFLVASPFSDGNREHTGFRISGFRPSFYRKSLAWDSAFFDSPGVLDPDELSCINKGFKETRDVRERRSESESRPNNDDGFCGDWFEAEPSIHKPKSKPKPKPKPKPCKMPNVANTALKSVDISSKNESTTRRRRGTVSSPKPQKPSASRNIPTRSKQDFSEKSNAKMKNTCTTSSGQNLFTKRNFDSVLPPTSVARSSIGIAPNAQTPRHLIIKTEPGKSRIRSSLSASMIWRRGDRNTISPSISHRPSEPLSSSVDKNKRGSRGLKIDPDIKKTVGVPLARYNENGAKHRQSPVSTPPNQYSGKYSVGSLWDKSFRPSGIRRPSPQIGFFDENTSPTPRYQDITRNRKLPRGVLPEGRSTQLASSNTDSCREEHKSHQFSKVAKNIKRPKLADHATNSSLVHQSLKPTKKKAIADQENRTKAKSSEPRNLSEYFGAIDLNREKNPTTQSSRKRAPLADKTSSCNYS